MTKKIGIIRCDAQSKNCAGFHCFPAMSNKTDQFQQYDAFELVGFDTCGGCCRGTSANIVAKAQRLKDNGAEVIHLGNCLISRCPVGKLYEKDIKEQVDVEVVPGTHARRATH